MKRTLGIFAALLLSFQASADFKSDLLALTGGREVRAVWLRFPWCDSSYTPIQAYSDLDDVGGSRHNQVAVLSTEDGKVRLLDSGRVVNHFEDEIFITRKDGSHVVWTNLNSHTAWIQAFDGKTPPVNLNLGTDCEVYAVQYNAATGEENLFVVNSDGSSVYRIPLKSDYTADLSKKTLVISSSWAGGTADASFSVSGDGMVAGGAFPWPDTKILNLSTKTANVRHAGTFGCNANIAPDKSYRFFHFTDSHDGIHMFDSALSTTYWDVMLTNNLPGNTITPMDCQSPRFTSDVRFMTLAYPGPYDGIEQAGGNGYFSMTAAQVKALNPSKIGHFCLGKFSPDFKSIEKWALICGGEDVRVINGTDGGMAWIAPTPSVAGRRGLVRSIASEQLRVLVSKGWIEATFPDGAGGEVSLVNTSGRLISRLSVCGNTVRMPASQAPRTCVITVTTGAGSRTIRMMSAPR